MRYSWDHSPHGAYPWELLAQPGDEVDLFGLIPALTIRESLKAWLAKHPGVTVELVREHRTQYIARRTA